MSHVGDRDRAVAVAEVLVVVDAQCSMDRREEIGNTDRVRDNLLCQLIRFSVQTTVTRSINGARCFRCSLTRTPETAVAMLS